MSDSKGSDLPALATPSSVPSAAAFDGKTGWFASFSVRLALAFAFLIVGATGASLGLVYTKTRPLILNQMANRLADIGRTGINLFGDAEFAAIERVRAQILKAQSEHGVVISPAKPGDYRDSISDEVERRIEDSEDYQHIVSVLRRIKGATRSEGTDQKGPSEHEVGRPTLEFVSLFIQVPGHATNEVVQFLADSDYAHPTVPAPPGNLLFNNSQALIDAFDGKVAVDKEFGFEQGMDILTAAIPIYDKDRKLVAVLRLYYDARGEANAVRELLSHSFLIVAGSLIAAVFLAGLLAWLLTRDVRKLRVGAARVRDRDFSVVMDVVRKDELGLLAATLNDMIAEIREYARGLEETNAAYSRFVPRQILEFLGHKSITDIRLGDQVQRQMTILFADIRSFTSISESMSARDNFDFINEYLRVVGPIVRKHNGFIDKYIGDAVMGLFPERPDDAVAAAIEIQRTLDEFNIEGADRGRPAIRVGVGIHRGNLMLGTVGEAERMDGTVISDAVNAASRLEGLTKTFGATIIVSNAVLDSLQAPAKFLHRYLGETQVKGKRQAILIHEVIDGDEADSARRKAITKSDFEKAVRAFEKGDITRSERYFLKVLKVHRLDPAARLYFNRCKESRKDQAKPEERGAKLISVDDDRFKKKL